MITGKDIRRAMAAINDNPTVKAMDIIGIEKIDEVLPRIDALARLNNDPRLATYLIGSRENMDVYKFLFDAIAEEPIARLPGPCCAEFVDVEAFFNRLMATAPLEFRRA